MEQSGKPAFFGVNPDWSGSWLLDWSGCPTQKSRSFTSGSICPLNSSCCYHSLHHSPHSSRYTHYSKHKSLPDVGKISQRWTASSAGTVCRLKISLRLLERRFLCDFHRSPQNGSIFMGTNVPKQKLVISYPAWSGETFQRFFPDPKWVSLRWTRTARLCAPILERRTTPHASDRSSTSQTAFWRARKEILGIAMTGSAQIFWRCFELPTSHFNS